MALFFKRANHGGSKKINAIARWIQRRMMFVRGFTAKETQKVISRIKKSEVNNELYVHS